MYLRLARFAVLLPLLFVAACASLPWEGHKDDFKIVGDQVYRRNSDFTFRAVHEPDLCMKGRGLEHKVTAMARVAEAGGNVIAFDLCGFSEDGSALDPASVELVSAYAERAEGQRMGVLVRVLGDEGLTAFRRNAAITAAKALAHEARAVYWIDGPDAAALAGEFKRLAPRVVLAAPGNGDLTVTTNPAEAGDSGLCLLVGAVPTDPRGTANFVLFGGPETYAMIDETYRTDVERAPWTPDNSMLSEEEREEGFESIFNGRDLDNWWSFNHDSKSFRVNDDGYIEWFEKGAGAIMSRDRYENFVLRLEYYLADKGANSGIFLRSPRAARQSRIGFEFQTIGDSELAEPDANSTAAVYDVLPALTTATRPEGEWNSVEIMLDGPHYRATLNGILVQDVNFDEIEEMRYRLRRGFIGLQDHSDNVWFRNVRIKRL